MSWSKDLSSPEVNPIKDRKLGETTWQFLTLLFLEKNPTLWMLVTITGCLDWKLKSFKIDQSHLSVAPRYKYFLIFFSLDGIKCLTQLNSLAVFNLSNYVVGLCIIDWSNWFQGRLTLSDLQLLIIQNIDCWLWSTASLS